MAHAEVRNRRKYEPKDLKLLWGLAAARCAMENCRTTLVEEASASDPIAVVGEIAHIVAHTDNGPRGDSLVPRNARDRYENLILLCPTCHTRIDGQPGKYSVAELREIKSRHEAWVRSSLAASMPKVGFAELEVLTQALVGTYALTAGDFSLIPPAEKMKKNGLTEAGCGLDLRLGMSKAREVSEFVVHYQQVDPTFPDRFVGRFVEEYRVRREVFAGDALFLDLVEFATASRTTMKDLAAARAIVAYLFERCEVFER